MMVDLLGLAQHQLERVRVLCDQVGLKFVEVPTEFPAGIGIAVGFGQTDFVVLSILSGGNESQLMVTSGIWNEINQDRLPALEAANRLTRNNTAFPVYLHDANVGWALLVQQTLPIELLLDSPDHFRVLVTSMPRMVIEYRASLPDQLNLGGRPWEWTPEDRHELLIRSML